MDFFFEIDEAVVLETVVVVVVVVFFHVKKNNVFFSWGRFQDPRKVRILGGQA